MKKNIGLALAVVFWTFVAFMHAGINIYIPSSYIAVMMLTNAIFAFFSIFVQRLVMVLYEVNVFEEPKSISGYFSKYTAIFTSGVNYYVQDVLSRLPFILNKLGSLLFFVLLFLTGVLVGGIFF
ncbi:hypothetical protein R4Z10_09255 [Niallia sp. XMNu-256]|uniref:hypothetical protein n=1 Tax=Niallia sp. XMNu-256 TaxID=3082444 RepID=UPI0030D440EB